MEAAVLDRFAVASSIQHPVRGAQAVETAPRSRKESARRALLMWSGLDGSCSSPEVAPSGLFAPDFRCQGPRRTQMSAAPGTDSGAGLGRGFTERSLAVTRMVEHGDRVISYVRFSGRHTGDFQGHRPTGKCMQADGYVVHRFNDDGLIAQEWSVFRWS